MATATVKKATKVLEQGLDALLGSRRKSDQIYELTCTLENLHAVQGRNDGEMRLTHKAFDEISDTTKTEGIASGESALPVARRRGRTQVKDKSVQHYRFERNGKPDHIYLQVGGPYGLFGKALRDAAVAKNKAQYWLPSLALIAFEPVAGRDDYVEVQAETVNDLRVEPRNSRGKERSMVPIYHERLSKPITITVRMIVNAECPRTMEEIAGLLHAMQGVPFGPAKRGKVAVQTVTRVQ